MARPSRGVARSANGHLAATCGMDCVESGLDRDRVEARLAREPNRLDRWNTCRPGTTRRRGHCAIRESKPKRVTGQTGRKSSCVEVGSGLISSRNSGAAILPNTIEREGCPRGSIVGPGQRKPCGVLVPPSRRAVRCTLGPRRPRHVARCLSAGRPDPTIGGDVLWLPHPVAS